MSPFFYLPTKKKDVHFKEDNYMSVNLQKGQKIDLTKNNPSLKKLLLVLVGTLLKSIQQTLTVTHQHSCAEMANW